MFAKYGGLGFSPFALESVRNPEEESLGKIYGLMNEIKPIYFENLSKFTCKHSFTTRRTQQSIEETWPTGALMIIQTGENEFYFIGKGVVTTFRLKDDKYINVGLLKVEDGNFFDGKWKVKRHLNGDQTHQGKHVSLPTERYSIQRVELYEYK
jgi:hypothetical protein